MMIRTVANTKAELNVVKARLELLMSRKEEIYTKYFPITSKFKEVSAHTNKLTDAMASYISEITAINPSTGMSLEQEIEEQRNKKGELEYFLNLMEQELMNTTGIENELFRKIAVEGHNPTKAVRKIAEKYNKEEQTIWKYYYSKIKEAVEKSK
jgi:hypothetical protein